MPTAILSTSSGTITGLEGCIAAFGVLVAAHVALLRGDSRALVVRMDLLGLALCAIGLLIQSTLFLAACIAYLVVDIAVTVAPLAAEARPRLKSLPLGLRPRANAAGLAFAGGLALLICAGVAIGIVIDGGGGSSPPAEIFASSYRVSGTCANGACTVNECSTPAPCGLENKGRLREGKPVDIVCQTGGEIATSPDGHHSHVWDRLPSGLYISDLFVEDTATNKFTRSLPHCSIA